MTSDSQRYIISNMHTYEIRYTDIYDIRYTDRFGIRYTQADMKSNNERYDEDIGVKVYHSQN